MLGFLRKRAVGSLISLVGLIVLVFFLSRLTGDPTALFLPVDATIEMREQFRDLHGLNDPLLVQFGRYVGDLMHLDFGDSLRKARPAIEVVTEAFAWVTTLFLAGSALGSSITGVSVGGALGLRGSFLLTSLCAAVALLVAVLALERHRAAVPAGAE